MADHGKERQTTDQGPSNAPLPVKRKLDLDSFDEGEEDGLKKTKLQPEISSSCPKETPNVVQAEEHGDGGEEDVEEVGVDRNGSGAVDKGKGVAAAVDKGKGKMVLEEDEEDDSSDDYDSGDMLGREDDESDFSEDPLAEVDLSNILPSRTRTRRRSPPPQGVYLLSDQDDDDYDEDEVNDNVDDSE